MKKLLIDMDDVICGKGFLAMVNEFLGTNYTEEDIPTYYIQDLVPEERKEAWTEFFKSKNIYDYTELLPDAVKVINSLCEKYEVYICTDFVFRDDEDKSADHLRNKFKYLKENFPNISARNYIFISNKNLVYCDIRIDDKVDNLYGDGETKILFTAYHNKYIKKEELEKLGIQRANNWKEIKKILL